MANAVTLRQLRYLVAAVEDGTMTRAATQLGVTSSAVSLAIGELESVFDVPLVTRTPGRSLSLTPIGRNSFAAMQRVLELAGSIETTAQEIVTGGGGVVRFGCFFAFAAYYAPDLVTSAAINDPPIDLDVVELRIVDVISQLLDGSIELGLTYGHTAPDGLQIEVIDHHSPYIVVAADHPLAGQPQIEVGELIDEPMVLLRQRRRSYFEEVVASCGYVPNISQVTDNMDTLLSMVASGMGWSILIGQPRSGTSHTGHLYAAAAIANPVEPMPIVVAWPASVELTPRAQVIVDLCHRFVPLRHATERIDK